MSILFFGMIENCNENISDDEDVQNVFIGLMGIIVVFIFSVFIMIYVYLQILMVDDVFLGFVIDRI